MVLELGIPSGPGTRVLEVGTGSGYTAALLAHMMGPGAVTSVEINPVVAALAERRLARLHIPVRVVHGAGLDYRHDGRFERVLVTCGLRTIPHSLIRSVEPGGVLLVPFGPAFMNAQVLVRFTVAEHRRVHGRIIGPVVQDALPWSFDARHAQPAQWSPRVPTRHDAVRLPQDFMPPGFPLGLFVTGLRVRHLHGALSRGAAGQRILTLRDTDPAAREPSLAHIAVGPGRSHATVTEYGPRPLAEDVLAAYEWWRALGKPALSTFKITVTAKGTRVWLDTPAKSWPL
nr:methyltransferase domain-containing protein [Streptomyces sp. SID11385]